MLQGLLLILLLVFVIIAVAAMMVVRIVAKGLGMFRDAARTASGDFAGGSRAGKRHGDRQHAGGGSYSSARCTASGRADGARTHTTASGTTIIDNRDPEAAGRKIFADGDGEYVDFEESR